MKKCTVPLNNVKINTSKIYNYTIFTEYPQCIGRVLNTGRLRAQITNSFSGHDDVFRFSILMMTQTT